MIDYRPVVLLLKNCPLCNSTNTKPIRSEKNIIYPHTHPEIQAFNHTWIQLLKCLECHFRFTKEIPISETFFINRYDNPWFDAEKEISAFRKNEILEDIFKTFKPFKERFKTAPKLLDVGSFAGKLIYFAKLEGYIPEGIEVNEKIAKFVEKKFKIKVRCLEFQKIELPDEHFDFITIIDVLEHLREPKKIIKKLHNGLTLEGVLYIKVPNAPMQILKQNIASFFHISDAGIFENFGHINHFNIKSLKKVLNDCGFNILKIEMSKSESWSEDKKFFKVRNALRKLYCYFSRCLYFLTGIPLGLNLNIIVRKKRSST